MKTKVVGEVVFSGKLNSDADSAEAALEAAGFAVVRMPEYLHEHTVVLGDEVFEASKSGGTADEVWKEIDEIVRPFGGDCQVCGEVSTDRRPFTDLSPYGDN